MTITQIAVATASIPIIAFIISKVPFRKIMKTIKERKNQKKGTTIKFNSVQKGEIGERQVAKQLSQLSQTDYLVINDLLLMLGGTSVQIDHIVLSERGFYIIETKNRKGFIYKQNEEFWVQDTGRKIFFYSPIKQNDGHIQILRKIFGLTYKEMFHPIVVFPNDAILDISDKEVTKTDMLIAKIQDEYHPKVMSKQQMLKFYTALTKMNANNKKNRELHKQYVQQRKNQHLN